MRAVRRLLRGGGDPLAEHTTAAGDEAELVDAEHGARRRRARLDGRRRDRRTRRALGTTDATDATTAGTPAELGVDAATAVDPAVAAGADTPTGCVVPPPSAAPLHADRARITSPTAAPRRARAGRVRGIGRSSRVGTVRRHRPWVISS